MASLRQLATLAHLTHVTSGEDRSPTLYFADGTQTCRIRQEHKKGPKLKAYIGDVTRFRIFYKAKTDKATLEERVDDLPGLVTEAPTKFSNKPQDGWYQLEYSTMNNTAKGKVKSGRHFSAGTVVVNSESPLIKDLTQTEINGLLDKMTAEFG
ncbi:hypothetical protein GCM10027167_37340 [Nocardia heshunensis]